MPGLWLEAPTRRSFNVTHRTTSNSETRHFCYSGTRLGLLRVLDFIRRLHRPPIIQTLFASLPGLELHLFLFLTIAFPPLFEGLPIVQPSRCATCLAEEVQNAVAVHPHALKMLRQQRLPVLARDDDGADMWLPRQGRKPGVGVDIEVRGDLVVEVGLVGGWGANAMEDQRDLDERWDGGHGLREDGMICGDRGGGPRREFVFLNVAPDDDGLNGPRGAVCCRRGWCGRLWGGWSRWWVCFRSRRWVCFRRRRLLRRGFWLRIGVYVVPFWVIDRRHGEWYGSASWGRISEHRVNVRRSSPHSMHGPTQCMVFLIKIYQNTSFYTTCNFLAF